jgi:tRNA-specific 2-thiouridylase
VLVALSGGVDSSVALLLARRAGWECVAVTLRLWEDVAAADGGERACCPSGAYGRIAWLVERLRTEHHWVDARTAFKHAVVDRYLGSVRAGLTTNPCVACNGGFRFAALLAEADRHGCEQVVTGHYARLDRGAVAIAADARKDQSYVLAGLDATARSRLLLPLGTRTKAQVRALAGAAGLPTAGAAESMDLCFIPDGDHRAFLVRHGASGPAGSLVDATGRVVGRHDGAALRTIGQRRGLGAALGRPAYVIGRDVARGVVVVGDREDLLVEEVAVTGLDWHVDPEEAGPLAARMSAHGRHVGARVAPDGGAVLLDRPSPRPAPGQAIVLYAADGRVAAAATAALSRFAATA